MRAMCGRGAVLLFATLLAGWIGPGLTFGASPDRQARKAFEAGLRFEQANQFERALDAYSKAIEASPDNLQAHAHRAKMRIALRDYIHAIDDLSVLIRLQPEDAIAYRQRAEAYARANQPEKAIADYNQAALLQLDTPALYNGRAAAYAALGKTQDAIDDYTRGIRLRLDDPEPIKERETSM